MRAFLAVPLSPAGLLAVEEIQQCLQEFDAFSDFRWVPPANIHLTLRFLGEISEEEAGPVAAALEAACRQARACSFELNRLGVFPRLKTPNVLWAGPDETPSALSSLAEDLDDALEAAGFAREKRAFRAHLTLARHRRGKKSPRELGRAIEEAEKKCLASRPALSLTEAVLLKSELRPGGAVHTILRKAGLPGR